MGRHSRRGPAPKGDAADTTGRRRGAGADSARGSGGAARAEGAPAPGMPGRGAPGAGSGAGSGAGAGAGAGGPRLADGTPAHGFPRLADGTPAHGYPRLPDGTPAHGFPRMPDGRMPDGRVADGRVADGRAPDGRVADGASARGGAASVRGGHPEQHETGGGWGEFRGRGAAGAAAGSGSGGGSGGGGIPRQRPTPPGGPRQEYVDAFDAGDGDDGVLVSRQQGRPDDPYGSVTRWERGPEREREGAGRVGVLTEPREPDEDLVPPVAPERAKGGKGRTFTGIAALAVTTVLAVVVAGQVRDGGDDDSVQSRAAAEQARDARDPASRGDGRPTASESPSPPAPLSYDQKMSQLYPLGESLAGPGTFEAIEGVDKAPGSGEKYTYRVDVEEGLGLDGELFAEAVQTTLNDERSWAHDGGRTFERIHSGSPDFVITLASPGTTAEWCAMSGLDTTIDNVSCDSASTERVMINAYRWAQGSETYGDDEILSYRQMLINHEVGHRLGYTHVTCDKDGDLAPVMQQQTKFLEFDGVRCLPNPWPYPGDAGR
ncbi:DUF3152 domain-containing protein [Streptomyces sp. NPDC004610]|uniref:DUF3152 domain-containing protein n=1 Tax=unclassified Streptomyces TaxID=2593676 RepID=UPI0033B96BE6